MTQGANCPIRSFILTGSCLTRMSHFPSIMVSWKWSRFYYPLVKLTSFHQPQPSAGIWPGTSSYRWSVVLFYVSLDKRRSRGKIPLWVPLGASLRCWLLLALPACFSRFIIYLSRFGILGIANARCDLMCVVRLGARAVLGGLGLLVGAAWPLLSWLLAAGCWLAAGGGGTSQHQTAFVFLPLFPSGFIV